MWWVMIWVFLLLMAGAYLGMRLWGLWGQTKELGAELLIAQRRLDDVQGRLKVLGDATGPPEETAPPEELAVFVDPATAAKQRDRARAAGRHARRQRGLTHPGWAKHID
jgi:hypothetical protein